MDPFWIGFASGGLCTMGLIVFVGLIAVCVKTGDSPFAAHIRIPELPPLPAPPKSPGCAHDDYQDWCEGCRH